ncbi:hypothetical protein, partial [Streptomyces boluensis]
GRVRAGLSAVLLVLACLITPLGALSTWAKYEIGDADNYVATMAPLASEPAVRETVADAATGEIMKQIDVGPLQDTVEAFLHEAILSFTDTAAFRTAWDAANRAAHDAVQDSLNNGGDSSVAIDLAPITEQIKTQLIEDGVPFAHSIPITHTEVTVLDAQDLGTARKGFHMLQVAGIWLPLGALVCAVVGIALAVRRRRAVMATGLGLALSAAALAVALAVGRSLTLDDLPRDLSRPAVAAVYDALTSTLRTTAWVIVAVGLAVALVAWAGGRFG